MNSDTRKWISERFMRFGLFAAMFAGYFSIALVYALGTVNDVTKQAFFRYERNYAFTNKTYNSSAVDGVVGTSGDPIVQVGVTTSFNTMNLPFLFYGSLFTCAFLYGLMGMIKGRFIQSLDSTWAAISQAATGLGDEERSPAEQKAFLEKERDENEKMQRANKWDTSLEHFTLYATRTLMQCVMNTTTVYLFGNKNHETMLLVVACTIAFTTCAYFIDTLNAGFDVVKRQNHAVLPELFSMISATRTAFGFVLPTVLVVVLVYVYNAPKTQAQAAAGSGLASADAVHMMYVATFAESIMTYVATISLAFLSKEDMSKLRYSDMNGHNVIHLIQHFSLFTWVAVFTMYAKSYFYVAAYL